jgi:hypothetical protein
VRVAKRLGNIAEIAELRESIPSVLGPDSLIVSRVLYSDTHAGDEIKTAEIETLQAELTDLRRVVSCGKSLRTFIESMAELAVTAQAEGRSIIFT